MMSYQFPLTYKKMILLIKPILMAFATSDSVKKLLIDILRKLVSTTDNVVDDKAVDFIEQSLFTNKKVFT